MQPATTINRPTIRGENPPLPHVTLANNHDSQCRILLPVQVVLAILVIILGSVFYLFTVPGLYYFFLAVLYGLLSFLLWESYSRNWDQAHQLHELIPLYAYNTEFTTVLADNSILKTAIHFQIPNDRQSIIEQLNRVTEKEMLLFVGPRNIPPSGSEVQNQLHIALVQFQHENQIQILRVEVPMNVHIPLKQQSGGPIYV